MPAETPSRSSSFVTASEVAARYGVKPNTVHRWVQDGKIPAHRTPGGRLRFLWSEIAMAAGGDLPIGPLEFVALLDLEAGQ